MSFGKFGLLRITIFPSKNEPFSWIVPSLKGELDYPRLLEASGHPGTKCAVRVFTLQPDKPL